MKRGAEVDPRSLSERELHEYVAEVEGHESQVTGVVGYFYRMYRAEVLARLGGVTNREILEIGCGEGHQSGRLLEICDSLYGIDVSHRAITRAQARCSGAKFGVGDSVWDLPIMPFALQGNHPLNAIFAKGSGHRV